MKEISPRVIPVPSRKLLNLSQYPRSTSPLCFWLSTGAAAAAPITTRSSVNLNRVIHGGGGGGWVKFAFRDFLYVLYLYFCTTKKNRYLQRQNLQIVKGLKNNSLCDDVYRSKVESKAQVST